MDFSARLKSNYDNVGLLMFLHFICFLIVTYAAYVSLMLHICKSKCTNITYCDIDFQEMDVSLAVVRSSLVA